MKKFLFSVLILSLCVFAYEEVPLLVDTSVIDAELEKDNKELIQFKSKKKINNTNYVKDKKIEFEKTKLKLDTRQIHHQRTLDYMNNKNGTMLPIF